MKLLFNLSTNEDDLHRFQDREDFEHYLRGFDGVEFMDMGGDSEKIVPKEKVLGLHMYFFPFWVDFWKGNEEALKKEFDTRENWVKAYGGTTKEALLRRYRKDLETAHAYGAKYVVFHVSEASVEESFTWNYSHTSEEVIDATAELLNELFAEEDGELLLLMENLWQPGLTFTEPKMTKRLLERVNYKNKGFMLDTGHLLHTNTALRTQEEGIAYIHKMLDEHGELCRFIKGIHLNQSLTGEYCEKTRNNPPQMEPTYEGRYGQMFFHAFAVDQHQPFTGEGIQKLVERIDPEYVTFEFITENRAQHEAYLKEQLEALGLSNIR